MAELTEDARERARRDLQTVISTARAASSLLETDDGYTASSLRRDIAAIDAILLRIRRSLPAPGGSGA